MIAIKLNYFKLRMHKSKFLFFFIIKLIYFMKLINSIILAKLLVRINSTISNLIFEFILKIINKVIFLILRNVKK